MPDPDALILHGRFVDPARPALREGWLSVARGRIVAFDTVAPPAAAGAAVELEGWVVPGLIDAHIHLSLDGGNDPGATLRAESHTATVVRSLSHLQDHLRAGVTTVRDLGGPNELAIDLARAVEDGRAQGPTVVACGRNITMTGGHAHATGIEADGPDAVRRAARSQLKVGARLLKFMATGGVMTPGVRAGAEALTESELRAGVEEAHKASKRTAAHAQGLAGIKNALRAGIDTIEHGAFDHWDDEVLGRMTDADHPVWLVPTLAAPDGILAGEGRVPAWAVEKTRPIAERHRANALEAYRAGVRIAAGTDAGTPLNPHGNLPRELELLAAIGLPLTAVLQAATMHAAEALDLAGEVGSLAPGARADLVVLGGDPLERVSAYREVRAVFKGGQRLALA